MAYHYSRKLRLPFEDVVLKLKVSLKDQGFDLLNIIDMKHALKSKLNVRFRNYHILTACHTDMCYRAISLDPNIGNLLPCSIVVQEHENGEVEVNGMNPLESLDQNMVTPSLLLVGNLVSSHLRTAIDSLRAQPASFSFSYN